MTTVSTPADTADARVHIPDAHARLSVGIYLGWLATGVFEGPLRGGLSAIGLANVLYLRDLVMVTATALAFARPWTRGLPQPPGLFVMAWVLAVHLCIGILVSGNLFNAFFGLKIFFPVFYALAMYPTVEKEFGFFIRAMALFFVVSAVGVFVNYFVGEMPWEGITYDTAFGSVATTKTWWMEGGVRRLPGLARTSVDVAMILGVSSVILAAVANSLWARALIIGVAVWAIVLSTSKGMVLAMAIAALWVVPSRQSAFSFRIGRALAALLLVLTCALPSVFAIVTVTEHPLDIPPLLSSMWERFSWMWPTAFASVPDHFGALTGAGLGGIGTPLGLIPLANSADSIFAYYYVSFGLIGLVYLAFPMLALFGREAEHDSRSFVWIALLIITYGYGASTNMIEQTFFCGVLGLIYGKAFAVWRRRGEPQ
jgi:hypothetical protein